MKNLSKEIREAKQELYRDIWGLFWEAELSPHQISEQMDLFMPDIFKAIDYETKKRGLQDHRRIKLYKQDYHGLPKDEEFWTSYSRGWGRQYGQSKVINRDTFTKDKL